MYCIVMMVRKKRVQRASETGSLVLLVERQLTASKYGTHLLDCKTRFAYSTAPRPPVPIILNPLFSSSQPSKVSSAPRTTEHAKSRVVTSHGGYNDEFRTIMSVQALRSPSSSGSSEMSLATPIDTTSYSDVSDVSERLVRFDERCVLIPEPSSKYYKMRGVA